MTQPTFTRLVALLAAAVCASPVEAQPAQRARIAATAQVMVPLQARAANTAGATGWTILGATAGAVIGGLTGGLIGAATTRAAACDNGDPDGCLGAQLPRALWGTGIGITVGTPIGAHFGNRRRGRVAYTALASAVLFAGEVIALQSLVDDGRTEHKRTVVGIAVAVPVLQIVATTLVERALPARGP